MSVVDTHTQPGGDASARFTALFRATHGDLVRYVRARCPRDRVDDVVAETFLTAWRRFEQVPGDDGAARAWLFVTARNLLLNDNRREGRREHLPLLIELNTDSGQGDGAGGSGERVERGSAWNLETSGAPPGGHPYIDDDIASRLDLAAALGSLSDADQEVLGLAVVDGLTPAEAGVVLGISANTYAARLSRARKRLAAALAPRPTNPSESDGTDTFRSTP